MKGKKNLYKKNGEDEQEEAYKKASKNIDPPPPNHNLNLFFINEKSVSVPWKRVPVTYFRVYICLAKENI